MATTQKLAELFRSISQDNLSNAKKIADKICDKEADKGNLNVAKTLRGALHASSTGLSNGASTSEVTASFMPESSGLKRLDESKEVQEVALSRKSRIEIDQILLEYRYRKLLQKNRLRPRSKLLFYGPPGCGKTLTATVIAKQLNLPAYLVKFDEIIGSYLGQTAARLRQIFSFIEQTPCVLLLDEIDAIGRGRGNERDVGELDRIVVSLLQELEYANALGLVIATTNIPDDLDRALWRRFDLSIAFEKPTSAQLKIFAKKLAKNMEFKLSDRMLKQAVLADNYDGCEKAILNEIRRSVIANEQAKHG